MIRPVVAWLLLGLAFLPEAASAASTSVSFILVNDIYLMGDTAGPDGNRRGGFARLAAVVKAERAKGGHVILAHGGDTISPSPSSGMDRGARILALTNMIAPDAFAPGNHEFDFGKATFLQRMGEAKFPLYAANLRGPNGQPLPGFKERAILTFDDVRIGITGATSDETARTSTPEDLQFLPTIETMRGQAEQLRKDGADFVVAVVHADRKQDLALGALRTIDLVLTGHDHDLFVNFDGRNAVVESSFDAHYVAIVDVRIEVTERDGRRVTRWWPQFRVIDTATVTPDPEVAAQVAAFEQEYQRELTLPLATTAVTLDSAGAIVRTREAAIGNVIADAMRGMARADVAIMNGGGIRSNKIYPPDTVLTRGDILAEMPFGNRLIILELSGRDLRAAIENGLSLLPNPAGRFPQISGMTVEADTARAAGSRVTFVTIGGAPLDPDKIYKVATNDFMARGGDGYVMFRDAKRVLPEADSPLLASQTAQYLESVGTIRTGVEGRLVVK